MIEVDNAQRAEWGAAAMEAFTSLVFGGRAPELLHPDDHQNAVGDLICDLLHYARQNGLDPLAAHGSGLLHFEAEEAEEAEEMAEEAQPAGPMLCDGCGKLWTDLMFGEAAEGCPDCEGALRHHPAEWLNAANSDVPEAATVPAAPETLPYIGPSTPHAVIRDELSRIADTMPPGRDREVIEEAADRAQDRVDEGADDDDD